MRGTPSPRALRSATVPKPAMVRRLTDLTRRARRKRRRHDHVGQRRHELDQRDVGGGAAAGVAFQIETRVGGDRTHRDGRAGLIGLTS